MKKVVCCLEKFIITLFSESYSCYVYAVETEMWHSISSNAQYSNSHSARGPMNEKARDTSNEFKQTFLTTMLFDKRQ